VLWAHSFACGPSFRRGFSKSQQQKEYGEIYDLARHLLMTYDGSGKTFFLGHWEGDGWLRGSVSRDNDARATPRAIQGMIDPQGRQRGFWMIDDHGVKQPIYEMHRRYYEKARAFVAGEIRRTGRPPDEEQFRRKAEEFLQ
jgi:hypothetical protein